MSDCYNEARESIKAVKIILNDCVDLKSKGFTNDSIELILGESLDQDIINNIIDILSDRNEMDNIKDKLKNEPKS